MEQIKVEEASLANKQEAKEIGLRYVANAQTGFTRKKIRGNFSYFMENGKEIKDKAILDRILKMVIPPAWDQVWICSDPKGHLQATGRDLRGRKQYIYHSLWRAHRDQNKYAHMLDFARALPRIRRRVEIDLSKRGLPREKVIAAVVRLLERTLIRVGNEEYARTNHSYGISTMRNRHVQVRGSLIKFDFRGKSGQDHHILLQDPALAKIVKQCQELPGQELFGYWDDRHQIHHIESGDVNNYIRSIAGREFTAKDFRTWLGTVLAAHAFSRAEPSLSTKQIKKTTVAVITQVSKALGNTPAICRKSYIHPEIFRSYEAGISIAATRDQRLECLHQKEALVQVEKSVLKLLKERLPSARSRSGLN